MKTFHAKNITSNKFGSVNLISSRIISVVYIIVLFWLPGVSNERYHLYRVAFEFQLTSSNERNNSLQVFD